MREPRLGDDIDDFCVRCKRITNHAVVSVVNGAPAKVRCRTCHSDHDYRHEQAPPPKVDLRKQALFNEVLKKVNPDDLGKASELADVPDIPELDEGAEEADAETAEVVDEPPLAPAPKAKAKAAKGKGRK
ncbi:MAG: hypothetical protein LAQ69_08360 [Acidobacteriia bacterium]|nr:hypothetical protein [Terriglobia bacterium]